MELTIENLILFLEKSYPYDNGFTPFTMFRDDSRECTFDGIDAVDLLEGLSKEFNVTFENFNFHQYFLDEAELSYFTWNAQSKRIIKNELTVQLLFEYMRENVKGSI